MIDKITNNVNEIEYYYNIGSIHGEIRMMLSKYIYGVNFFDELVNLYERIFEQVENLQINHETYEIKFDIKGPTLRFQVNFAHCMYFTMQGYLNDLHNCIDIFEKDNPRYEEIKNNIDILMNENYYITLFRTSYIKHENSTSCIISL